MAGGCTPRGPHAAAPAVLLALALLAAAVPLRGEEAPSPGGSTFPRLTALQGSRAVVRGVILGRTGSISLLTEQGTLRSLVVTPATRVEGQRASPGDLRVYDLISADGAVNADGSVTATRVRVEFAATAATRVMGVISRLQGESGLILGTSVVVNVPPDTWVIRGTGRRAAGELAPGMSVTVFGTSSGAQTVPLVLTARIIIVSR